MWPFRRKAKRLTPSVADIIGKSALDISLAFGKAAGTLFEPLDRKYQIKHRARSAWAWHLRHWRQLSGE